MNNTPEMSIDQISLKGEKVLLIGGAGFIGHHLALGLKKVGAKVLIIDDLQINNVTKILTDYNLDDFKRKLYLSFIFERLDLLRASKIDVLNIFWNHIHFC